MNKIKGYLLLLIILIISFNCKNEKSSINTTKPTIVAGIISNYNEIPNTKIVKLHVFERGQNDPTMESKIASDGSFKIKFNALKSNEYFLKPFLDTHIYADPGDSIYIRINVRDSKLTVFSGDSKIKNDLLLTYYKHGYFTSKSTSLREMINLKPPEFISYREDIRSNNLNSLEKFIAEFGPPEDIITSLEAQIDNENYTRLLEYGLSHCSPINDEFDLELKMENKHKYFSKVTNGIDRDIEFLVSHSSYNKVLLMYLRYLSQNILEEYFSSDDPIIEKEEKYKEAIINEIVNQIDIPILKDEFLFSYASSIIKSHDLVFYEKFHTLFDENITSKTLKKELSDLYLLEKKDNSIINPMKNYGIENFLASDKLTGTIKQNLGKIHYIDFWGAWCSPCRKDMIESRDSVEVAIKEGRVAVTYVCSNSNPKKEQDFLDENNIPGDHLFIEGKEWSEIMSSFGNMAFPFQVIIDQNGGVIAKGSHYRFNSGLTRRIFSELEKES